MSVGKDSEEEGGEVVVAEEGEEEACTEQIKARNVENIVYVLPPKNSYIHFLKKVEEFMLRCSSGGGGIETVRLCRYVRVPSLNMASAHAGSVVEQRRRNKMPDDDFIY